MSSEKRARRSAQEDEPLPKRQKQLHAQEEKPEETPEETPAVAEENNADDEQAEESGVHSNKTFAELGLEPVLCEACTAVGYERATKIQAAAIPPSLEGRDVIALAETGSGKTAAFVLPVLQQLLHKEQSMHTLVLAPTRELADQIAQQFRALGSGIGVRVATIIGGVDMMQQAIALQKKPHVIVASPGRIVDHLENTRGFHLRQLKYLIFDEADRLLGMDFEKPIDRLLQVIPRAGRRTMLFSATMTSKVRKLQRASLQDPVKVSVSASKYQTVKTLTQQYKFLPAKYKDVYLVAALNALSGKSAIVFACTVKQAQRLTFLLRNLGFAALPLHGRMKQQKRMGALQKFKAEGAKRESGTILVATDVANRGLDIPSVDLVVNYDIPQNSKEYVHRVGRTARAGRSGLAITLVSQYDVELYKRIEMLIGKKLDEFDMPHEEAMLLMEKVGEAQRLAALELREENERAGKKGGRKNDSRMNSKRRGRRR